jgi:hypothetical protein
VQWSSTTLVTVELTAGGVTSLGYSYADETAAPLCERLLRSIVIGDVLDEARELIDSQAIDVLRTDVTHRGGITNFLKIGHFAEICHIPFSARTSPSIHTSLCCALPSAINIEYFADHARVESMLFDGVRKPVKSDLKPDFSRPGLGIELKRGEAEKFKVFSATVGNAS